MDAAGDSEYELLYAELKASRDLRLKAKTKLKNSALHKAAAKSRATRKLIKRAVAHNNRERLKAYRKSLRGIMSVHLNNILKRKKHVTITIDNLIDLWNKQSGRCALTGVEMVTTAGDPFKVSVDRIDSAAGYCPNNIQLVCTWVNMAKYTLSNEKFIAWCKLVARHNP